LRKQILKSQHCQLFGSRVSQLLRCGGFALHLAAELALPDPIRQKADHVECV